MKQISVSDLINLFQKMYSEHWSYIWGKAEEGCVDCSGAFTYAFKQFGISCPHGSNAIARKKVVGNLLPISEAKPGMAAFKAMERGEDGYSLPAKYQGDADALDYYHIGLVDVDTRYVLNAKGVKSGFCRDALTAKNGWDFVAYLEDVDYGEGKGEQMMGNATVVLPSGAKGTTVNMRNGSSTSARVIEKVPVGTEVTVVSDYGQWMQIEYNGETGYMMSDYLEYGQQGESGMSDADTETIENALKSIDDAIELLRKAVDAIGGVVGRG